jgi:hypothetical protein
MLAYSSINHAGFVLLGLEAATARGVSASLYYLFAYTFMVIGSFAVVTLLGRRGDAAHDISSYRGLAKRQPLLALMFAVLLLAQAGAPFTTGLWAKLQVVLAAVDHQIPLAVIAMVSAAIAAFFYLRVAVLMYTPLPVPGAVPGAQPDAEEPVRLYADAGPSHGRDRAAAMAESQPEPIDERRAPQVAPGPAWTGTERNVAALDRLNAGLLLDQDPMTLALLEATGMLAPGVVEVTLERMVSDRAWRDLDLAALRAGQRAARRALPATCLHRAAILGAPGPPGSGPRRSQLRSK